LRTKRNIELDAFDVEGIVEFVIWRELPQPGYHP